MSFQVDNFRFDGENEELLSSDHEVIIPKGISSAEGLLRVYFDQLKFPGWFGFNWNALYESLTDLSWLSPGSVAVFHSDVPSLLESDLLVYLEVLSDAVTDWTPEDPYSLVVAFPECVREVILARTQ